MRSTLRQSLGRLAVLAALPLALAACHKEKKDEARTAQGEILEGSASDAMLPLDTVRSQPPFAPETVASGKPGKGNAGGELEAGATEAASEAAAAPVTAAAPAVQASASASPAQ
jgi:hypothetical protein